MKSGKSNTTGKWIAAVGVILFVCISVFCLCALTAGGVYYLVGGFNPPSAVATPEAPTPIPNALAQPTDTIAPVQPTDTVQPPIPTVEPTQAPEVTVTWWHINTIEGQRAYWQELADEYTAIHPNVTINITVLESEAFTSRLNTAMQSGDPPDIFQSWGGGVMNEYAKAGLLKDISASLDAEGGAWRNTFGQGALGVYSFKDRSYGVPWDMGIVGFWYNKTLFAQAGITSAPETWTEFLDDVKALKGAGITPIVIGEADRWPGTFWWAFLATRIGGKEAFDAAASRTGSFADPTFVEAGRELRNLIVLSPFQSGFLHDTYGDEAAIMGNGDAAMELMGQWAPAVDEGYGNGQINIRNTFGWFPFPMVEGGAGHPDDAYGGGNGFIVGKNAPPEAVDFLKYLTRAESQAECASEGFCIPVVKGGETGLTDPLMITVQKAIAEAKYIQLYYDQCLPPAMGGVIFDSVHGIFAGTLTPEQAAQAVENSAKQELG
jgi:raffinose/stachyose/melibiose transport system substrate-binding protein